MLTFDNLPILLTALGFTARNRNFSKVIGGVRLEVLLDTQQIIYPETDGLVVNERQTCNFSATENIVVLECVNRLLEKGYQPQHIELEPKWQLGRGASGGRADILVKDNFGKPLLIIECKTAGSEFKRAWTKTLQDGDQLFSYTQQISDTKFLCLYTSEMDGEKVKYSSYLIAHRDNERYLADNPRFKSFGSATDVKERFAVWRDTYKLDYTTKGLFEDNIQPYHIGKDKYTLADLHAISSADQQGKYHEFATILRQHNVSGRENAFDKLVNLFLCKLVDEAENPGDLKFYWKGVAYDTHFELLDRLQQLYQSGMGRFLGEKITYINKNDVSNAMRFIRQDADATQRAVWNLFVQQKFFTNNDFSLIDVHNEKLFYQNAEILLRILQMWQDIRLSNPGSHNQFLGDMFEGFLDQGVKQSEGQYFTPMPICRFILMSLPLESIVKASAVPPKAIDYACGAGHFLNELALQLKPLVEAHHQVDMKTYHQAIYGVEKEYRLSKVAKVSAFMYGQQDINICYGDALVKHHDAYPGIQDGSFDLLVANPPFSVRGFLETLPESDRRAYTLTDTVDKLDTANSIETFFLERAKQLLKPGGVAAIILPSSVLSNANGTYIRAREILLQYFDIVAIVELGSGTFGKTGTNTVTLFLRRKPTSPDTAEHYRGRVAEWFKADENQPVYRDEHLIDAYATHIGVPAADYKTLLRGEAGGAWMNHDHFEEYKKKFNDSGEVDKLSKQRAFKAFSAEAKEAELNKRFLINVQNIERDKIYHFVIASDQSNPVVVIRSPTDTKAQKRFLGYDWSNAKGDEGIKLIKDASDRHQTILFDESNRADSNKINVCISLNFAGQLTSVPSHLVEFVSVLPLITLIDFSKAGFEKQIGLSSVKHLTAIGKWPTARLLDITTIVNGGTPDTKNSAYWEGGQFCWATLVDTKKKYLTDTRRKITSDGLRFTNILPVDSVIFSSRATIGEVCINKVPTATNQGYKSFICHPGKLIPEYLYYVLCGLRSTFEGLIPSGSKYKEINSTIIGEFKIPLPPLTVQTNIATECEKIDVVCDAAENSVLVAKIAIDEAISLIYAGQAIWQSVDALSEDIQYGLNEAMNESGIGYKIFRMNEIVQRRMFDGGQMKCADISADEFAKYKLNRGDVLFNRTNSIEHVGKTGLFDLDGDYCFASYLVRVVPNPAKIIPEFMVLMMNSAAFQAEAKGKASKSINQANINATIMRNIKVPAPSLVDQQQLVDKVKKLEKQIADAQAVIAAAPARKQAILQRYL
jgi:type I restriction-modification system DNA methylase subunit/restriction endonuclease S subunit